MKHNPKYPIRHISVRVPWHDRAWDGCVCDNAKANSSCLVLKTCSLKRDDEAETSEEIRSQSIKNLAEEDYPACISERGMIMADFAIDKSILHPYIESSPTTHGHFRKTNLRFPAYSAAAVPYRWMRKENAVKLAEEYDLDYDAAQEPELDWQKNKKEDTNKGWLQEYRNQKALLNCFFEHFEEETSLIFFYAKQVPFIETPGRVIVGVGRLKRIIPSDKYSGSNNTFSAAYWEHMLLHSVRPKMEDGFLLPYHDAIKHQETNPDFDPLVLAVVAPGSIRQRLEFSFATEHVSNDSAIEILLHCYNTWTMAKELGISEHHDKAIAWIHNELQRVQKLRGHYPGLGAALCAFGIPKGHFVAAEIINGLKDDTQNPWQKFERALINHKGILSDEVAALIPVNSKRLYQRLADKDKTERLDLLHLLSRFDLTIEQAKRIYIREERELLSATANDSDILKNPYLIYELNIYQPDSVKLNTIDLGLFSKKKSVDLLPASVTFDDPLDSFRIRAITFQQLHLGASQGHTLLPRKELVKQIRTLVIDPACELNSDYYELAEEVFEGTIELAEMKNGDTAYQLTTLAACRNIIKQKVEDRINGKPLAVEDRWEELLLSSLEQTKNTILDEREAKAREEKVVSLKQISASRFSVLIGPAGTGKTTLLTVLASHPEIRKNGVLLLAPTGKARVRMEEVAKQVLNVTAKTLAQFLREFDRYDGDVQRYVFSTKKEDSYETIIVDEASMLTEEMLATTLDCLQYAKRFILVGDHRQLPPIGAGRPFVDVIQYLRTEDIENRFPRIGKGYAELTIKMRHGGANREDIQLAEWFGGDTLEPGADQIINDILSDKKSNFLRVIQWDNESDFDKKFESILVDELGLASIEDIQTFNRSLGSHDGRYFNDSNDADYFGIEPSINSIESWQILSPVREKEFGVRAINRKIHLLFRKKTIDYAIRGIRKPYPGGEYVEKKIPKPFGLEQIVYGDKVINLGNHSHDYVEPSVGSLQYIANGEIGLITGKFQRGNKIKTHPKFIKVEFSSQKGFTYSFAEWEFKEEGEPPLELAYALTVHKSQGSEFGKVFLIVPNPCFLLSREMLYTALTRQKEKVIVMFQGSAFDIKALSSPLRSDTLKRITNLFSNPELVEIDGNYLEKNLIHQASDGKMLRSKSELLIYQRLLDNNILPAYEKKLTVNEVEKLPDFTIENPEKGITYYWEHCGMMHDTEYRKRWEEKREWYLNNDIKPWEEGGGTNGTLIVTIDKPTKIEDGSTRGAISVMEIDTIIRDVFNR